MHVMMDTYKLVNKCTQAHYKCSVTAVKPYFPNTRVPVDGVQTDITHRLKTYIRHVTYQGH